MALAASSTPPRIIVIIGGGYCGTMLAVNLLQHPPAAPTHLVLVERRDQLGCGVAFAPHAYPYLLNVPAARMSADPEDATQLVRFARRRLPRAHAHSFLPRQLYGEYLRERLRLARLAAADWIRLDSLRGEVSAVRPDSTSGRLCVTLEQRALLADQVVLACGYPVPAVPAYAADVLDHRAYVRDAYRDAAVAPSDRAVLLIGTGLTMVDVALAAVARNPDVHIFALSRHGLLPTAQTVAFDAVLEPEVDLRRRLARPTARQMLRAVRLLVQTVQQRGGDWREAITRVREVAPLLWQGMSEPERRRFLRHARIYWDIHRHRMPPVIARRLAALRQSGQLRVRAGSVVQLCADGERLVALWRRRGHLDLQELWVDRVIECSGVDHALASSADPLWRQLLDEGLASADATGLGVRTGPHGVLVDAQGQLATSLFYVGPMLRAQYWEATAVGELRLRVGELATVLATSLSAAMSPAAPARQRPAALDSHSPVCHAVLTDAVTARG